MPRRWKIALPIAGASVIAMILTFLAPAAASRPAVLGLQDALAGSRATLFTPAPVMPLRSPVARAPETPPAKPATRTYAIQPGDSLSLIASRLYGAAGDWTVLYWANKAKLPDPNSVLAGTVLTVPALPAKIPAPPGMVPAAATPVTSGNGGGTPPPSGGGHYSYGQLEALWVSAGGPSWAEAAAATIAECESGGNPDAYNSSGATGLWQILGQVVPGNLWDPFINAANAVAKFTASGDTFAQWVCQA